MNYDKEEMMRLELAIMTVEELELIIKLATAELAAKQPKDTPAPPPESAPKTEEPASGLDDNGGLQRYSLRYKSGYNNRRYSAPWIARVLAWPVGGKTTLEFGEYLGNSDDGGETEILARPGDILRYGQKDNRRPSESASNWAVALPNGKINVLSQAEARKAYTGK